MYSIRFLIALGGNISSPGRKISQNFAAALGQLQTEGLRLAALSRFYRSPAFPAGSGPDYVNACAVILGPDDPEAVLAALHRIEASLGRERTLRWGARGIDLDLLAMGDRVCPDAETQTRWRSLPLAEQMRTAPTELILPHPRLAERAFVLIPLAEIAPGWCHPLTGQSVVEMCKALPEAEKTALEPFSRPFGTELGLSFPGEATK